MASVLSSDAKAVPKAPQGQLPSGLSLPNFRSRPRIVPLPKEVDSQDATKPDASSHPAKAKPVDNEPRTLTRTANHTTQPILVGFEYAEHGRLGDSLTLQWTDKKSYRASSKPFTLPNGLHVTYGQINGLGGDFYGTADPISDGKDLQDSMDRFMAAFKWLAYDETRNPDEALKLLGILEQEVNTVDKAVAAGKDPSFAYANDIPDETTKFEEITISRPEGTPGYLGLAQINWDHFGADARKAYTAGHSLAIQTAIKGDLPLAYAMNGHADHFLEDSFSAGHMRTPRRVIHNDIGTADVCSKFMHDEDNAIGLQVENPHGDSWTAYGDKRLLDKVDTDNHNMCRTALQASVNEIFEAWDTKKAKDPATYEALKFAPILETVKGNQGLVPLFRPDGYRRTDLSDRKDATYTYDYSYVGTLLEVEASGRWNYPIVM